MRVLTCVAVAPKLGLTVDMDAVNSVTRGLVGDSAFAVLPNVTPLATFLLTLGFQIVSSAWPLLNVVLTRNCVAVSREAILQTDS